jgi:hypothetical protein
MNHIRRILAAATTLAAALMALATAPVAYASLPPGYGRPADTHTTVRVVTTGGMPGWQIALIAAAAALVAATMAVLTDRARAARKMHATTA